MRLFFQMWHVVNFGFRGYFAKHELDSDRLGTFRNSGGRHLCLVALIDSITSFFCDFIDHSSISIGIISLR